MCPPIPRPQGRGPTNHHWDTTRGQYIHNDTKLPWTKGKRSAESAALQKNRKDDRKRVRGSDERNEQAELTAARKLRTAARRHPPPLVTRSEFAELAASCRTVLQANPAVMSQDEWQDECEKYMQHWHSMLRRGARATCHPICGMSECRSSSKHFTPRLPTR